MSEACTAVLISSNSALVDFTKEDFIGRSAALELSKQTFDRKLALLTFDPADNAQVPLEWKNLPFGMEVVRREGQEEVRLSLNIQSS